MSTPIVVCITDPDACTCGAPVSTPAGMHWKECPTNPYSKATPEERAWLEHRPGEDHEVWINRMRVSKGLEPINWKEER